MTVVHEPKPYTDVIIESALRVRRSADKHAEKLLAQVHDSWRRLNGTNLRSESCRRAIVRLLEYLDRIE